MKAWCSVRPEVHYRWDAISEGLRALGYEVMPAPTMDPGPDDILVIWNRYDSNHECANVFEDRGRPVVVIENGYLGKDWLGDQWYAISLHHHNGAGLWNVRGHERWDSLGVELAPWKLDGTQLVMLPQRGIGPPGVAMPQHWAAQTRRRITMAPGFDVVIRPHPGQSRDGPTLESDLANAYAVYTWGSGAALKALLMGIPAYYDFPKWIGGEASAFVGPNPLPPRRLSDESRLRMFRRLAWAMWRIGEIKSGEAFNTVLSRMPR